MTRGGLIAGGTAAFMFGIAAWIAIPRPRLAPMPTSIRALCDVDVDAVRRVMGQRFVRWAPMEGDGRLLASRTGLVASHWHEWEKRTRPLVPDGIVLRWATPWPATGNPAIRIAAAFFPYQHGHRHHWFVAIIESPPVGAALPAVRGLDQPLDVPLCRDGR